jgi:FAD/FMN-containing dehydrogenase
LSNVHHADMSLVWPNSNAVGVIGAFLGGGSGAFNGLHGFAVDHVLSIQLVTASGDILVLNSSSTGDESSLYQALQGAGHGFGIITSLTMRAFRIADLNMTKDKYWQGNFVFPSSAIDEAVDAFVEMLPPPGPLLPILIFSRAPPNHPAKGAPLVILAVSYFGPQADAEQAAAPILAAEITKKAALSKTSLGEVINMNSAAEMLNSHGGRKEFYNCMCRSVSAESIKKSFDRWIRFGEEAEDAKDRSTLVIGVWNTDALQENAVATEGDKTFYRHRDRGLFAQATGWYSDPATQTAADQFGSDVVAIIRETDTKQGLEPAVFANNMRFGEDMKEVYSIEMLQELKRLKNIWDPSGVFFTPACSW